MVPGAEDNWLKGDVLTVGRGYNGRVVHSLIRRWFDSCSTDTNGLMVALIGVVEKATYVLYRPKGGFQHTKALVNSSLGVCLDLE